MSQETMVGEPVQRTWLQQLVARKSITTLAEEANGSNQLRRSLSALDLMALGVGAIIGTGIFVIWGIVAAEHAGPSVILSFVVAGLASAFAGLCYAELASMIPVAGSAYTYTMATMGELPAWIIGWDLILEYLVASATVAVGFSGYFQQFLKEAFGAVVPPYLANSALAYKAGVFYVREGAGIDLIAFLFVICISAILVIGVKESARLNTTIVIFKLAVIVIVICSCAQFVRVENFTPFFPVQKPGDPFGKFGVGGMLQGATIVFFAYIGFDAVSTTAQEAKNPSRDLPIGILGSLLLCTVLYIAMAVVMIGMAPYTIYGVSHPISVAIETLGPSWKWLSILVALAAVAGLASVSLVMLMGQPRIFYSMAHDGLLPAVCAKIHPRFKTPYVTTIITGSICACLAAVLPIDVLSELTSVGTLFAFAMISVAVMILRIKEPNLERRFKVPGGPFIIPGLAFISSILLVVVASPETLLRLVIWLVIGLVIYTFYGRKHSKLNHPEMYPLEAYEKSPDFLAH